MNHEIEFKIIHMLDDPRWMKNKKKKKRRRKGKEDLFNQGLQ